MAILKATLAITIWSVAVGYGLWKLGVQHHHTDPLWAIGTAVALVIALMVNVYLFAKIGKGAQWRWFKS